MQGMGEGMRMIGRWGCVDTGVVDGWEVRQGMI